MTEKLVAQNVTVENPTELGSWFTSALSIASTIGKIAGSLLGANNNDYLEFRMSTSPNRDDASFDSAIFRKEDERILLYNSSTDYDLSLSFPDQNGLAAETLIVQKCSKTDVTNLLQKHSVGDVNELNLSSVMTNSAKTDDNTSHVTISAKSNNVIVTPNTRISLGSYFEIEISENVAKIFAIGSYVILGISLLNIRGAGDTTMKLLSPVVQSFSGNTSKTTKDIDTDDTESYYQILLPNAIKENSLVSINIEVDASSPCISVQTENMSLVTREEFSKIREHGTCLNPYIF